MAGFARTRGLLVRTLVAAAVGAAALTVAGCAGGSETSRFEPTDLGALGGSKSAAVAINDRGQVVGWSATDGGGEHAFLWEDGRMRDLGTLGGRQSHAWAINERGEIVGSSTTRSGKTHAFLWRKGKMIDLGSLDGRSEALAINERGQVVGSSTGGRPACKGCNPARVRAFLWQSGTLTPIGAAGIETYASALNDRGQVVGEVIDQTRGATLAFVWRDGRQDEVLLAGERATAATDVNERGQILVNGPTRTAVWERGIARDLGTLGGASTRGDAIDEQGRVVGRSQTTEGSWHPFLWADGEMTDLFAKDTPDVGLGATQEQLSARINDRGQVLIVLQKGEDERSWLWEEGERAELLGLGDSERAVALAFNGRDQVVGVSRLGGRQVSRAVLWTRS